MARQISFITFTGKLGNLIGYERGGKYFLRSMPEIVRQTPGTRRAAQRFGMASRKAALIRNAFYDELDIRCDSAHINRLNKVLITAAGNHAALKGFRFNQHAGTDRFLTLPPKLFRNGTVHIPAQFIVPYKGITALEIKVIATRIDFTTRQVCNKETVVMTIDPSVHFAGTDLSMDISGAGTLIVTLQIRALGKEGFFHNRQYLAADIIAVMEPQIPVYYSKPDYARQTPSQRDIPGYNNTGHEEVVQRFVKRE